MANLIDIKVPDIGDFRDVPIIEVLVKPGDRVKTEDPLITLESDKASMEVPSPVDGVVKEVRVKVGDKVSEGSLILVAEAQVAPAGLAPREKIKEGGRSTGEGAPVADYGAASGVYEVIEVRVPDIGDFKNVPIIEVAVKSGDKVAPEDPLITLESDKASMEVPSPTAGTVKDVSVKIGDKVGEGSLILTLETGLTHAAPAAPAATRAAPGAPMPMAARHVGEADHECDMLVLGAGPGGYSAAFRSADLGMTTVLVERYPTLGGVCLNVGCIPSKALLHTASVIDEVKQMAAHGISYSAPQIDLAKLRTHKEKVVGKLTGGLAGMAKARRVTVLEGIGKFLDPHHLEVAAKNGSGRKVVKFDKSIIAAGSEAIKLPFIPDDPRVIDSTGALELRQMPKSMLVIGGGIIGLEVATVYSTLGTRIDVVEMLDGLMSGAGSRQSLGEEERRSFRQGHAEDQDRVRGRHDRRHQHRLRGREGAGPTAALRYGAGGGGAQSQRQENRCRQGRRGRERPRLHSSRQADANQYAAHLRHRRHRWPAHAGPQGGARSPRCGGNRGRQEQCFRSAPDPVGCLYRPGSRMGGSHRGPV